MAKEEEDKQWLMKDGRHVMWGNSSDLKRRWRFLQRATLKRDRQRRRDKRHG